MLALNSHSNVRYQRISQKVSVPQTGDCLSHTINAIYQYTHKYKLTSYSKEEKCWLINLQGSNFFLKSNAFKDAIQVNLKY